MIASYNPLPGKEFVRTVADRRAAGRALRKEVPRSSHAEWSPVADRPDPISLLEEQNLTRQAQLVPIRYGRMAASPFGFLRGAAVVMAQDLAATPVTGLGVQVCGDAHLSNFGIYATPEREQVFDVNDFIDIVQKVVGVGSVGTRCYIALFRGNESSDPLFLQVKEAQASVLERHLGPSAYSSHGQRVVSGQHIMQAASDLFLGWTETDSIDFYIRQLRDMKLSVNIASLNPQRFIDYCRLCGWTLARAHARSGDPAQISGYLGRGDRFERAIAAFAETYADQTGQDYAALVAAVQAGRISVEGTSPGIDSQ